jgi:hypothetical protein
MKELFGLAVLLAFALASCSTMQYTANPQDGTSSGVQVLYDYPGVPFKNLGVVDLDYYQPGFREPTVTDALPKLKAKVLEVGGNALIIRNQRIGRNNNRFISISAEVLLIQGTTGSEGHR